MIERDWDTSCPDWGERILTGRPLVPNLPLYKRHRDKALAIFKMLRLPDVKGDPVIGDVTAGRAYQIVAALFGSYDKESDLRHISEFFILIPKKNGKSTFAGLLR